MSEYTVRIPTASFGLNSDKLKECIEASNANPESLKVYGSDEAERYRNTMGINRTFDININQGETLTPLGVIKSAKLDGLYMDITVEIASAIAPLFDNKIFTVTPKFVHIRKQVKIVFYGLIKTNQIM